ncbi:SDR family oxidoreductase [Catellatospora sp. NPDC049609]|uniref:SDR family NAD(P)-dependent oxidoreductase n=1 Tax=Catellatospora sp. NPDC049609 TaxID=3155505 RepID=UPI0034222F18
MTEYAGLVAAVTGGASGIGAAVAAVLAERGAAVAILDRAPGEGGPHLAVTADVTAPLDDAMARVVASLGSLDILVNCAGISAVGTVEQADDEEWHRCLDVNVVGIARASRAALPYLRGSKHGVIVNISSIAAGAGLVNRAVYSATKGAVHALTLAMAADLVGEGIRVVCVAPGTVDTPWVARLLAGAADPAEEKRRLAARQPTGRLVTADEVAEAVAYLASPRSGATTGTSLAVDGGMSGLRLVR